MENRNSSHFYVDINEWIKKADKFVLKKLGKEI